MNSGINARDSFQHPPRTATSTGQRVSRASASLAHHRQLWVVKRPSDRTIARLRVISCSCSALDSSRSSSLHLPLSAFRETLALPSADSGPVDRPRDCFDRCGRLGGAVVSASRLSLASGINMRAPVSVADPYRLRHGPLCVIRRLAYVACAGGATWAQVVAPVGPAPLQSRSVRVIELYALTSLHTFSAS
jgi:hypothetical protein